MGAAGRFTSPGVGAIGAMPSTSSRTLLTSAWLSKGLVMWPSAFASRARVSSNASNVPASSSTGTPLRDGSFLIASQTSYPFRFGMTTSARTMSGLCSRARESASSPLSTAMT
jgi:hypothetical protein